MEQSIQKYQSTIAEKITSNLPMLQKGHEIAIAALKHIQSIKITSDEQREEIMNELAQARGVYNKVKAFREEITQPLDQVKDYLMSFERPLDDSKKDNEFALARQVLNDYDQLKLEQKRDAEIAAEMQRQVANKKAEYRAAVARQIIECAAGQERTVIQGMAKWEQSITLENYEQKVKDIHAPRDISIDPAKYNACFNMNFTRSPLISERDTKEYIESLKAEFPYNEMNDKYKAVAVRIVNEYRSRMESIKATLEEISKAKDAAEALRLRNEELALEQAKAMKLIEDQASEKVNEVQTNQDLAQVESEFVRQAQTQDLEAGPSKKVASFTDDNLWLKPLVEAIGIVATSTKVNVRKKNGEYVDHIGWWLKNFEGLGKTLPGIELKEAAKTIIKSKKDE